MRTPVLKGSTRQGILYLKEGGMNQEMGQHFCCTHICISRMIACFNTGVPFMECRPLPTMTLMSGYPFVRASLRAFSVNLIASATRKP
jgi:hypothetical protein